MGSALRRAAEGEDRDERGDGGDDEQPAQLVHAARHAHGFAHGPQEEVAAEDAEEQQCRQEGGLELTLAEVQRAHDPGRHGNSVGRRESA